MSFIGTTEPKYLLTISGWFFTASEKEQNIIPSLLNSFLKVVATETLSNTASTATLWLFLIPARNSCSLSGIPNLSYALSNSGSISSKDLGLSLSDLGAAK